MKNNIDIKFINVFKKFLFISITLGSFFILIIYIIYTFGEKNEKNTLEANESSILIQNSTKIILNFKTVVTDLLYISKQQELYKILDSRKKINKNNLEIDWLSLSRSKGIYDQIRYIDRIGNEIIRINYNKGKPFLVPSRLLQNKSNRYYFKNALSLNNNEIFVSPLDLNIEHGKTEIPLKPMIRFGTPVFDKGGIKKGIVLLNYLAENLVNDFKSSSIKIHGKPMLINSDGYWLVGAKAEDEWGFMYNNEVTFANRYPAAWEKISKQDSGQFYNPHGLFTFTTIYPVTESYNLISGANDVSRHSPYYLNAKSYYWKALLLLPQNIIADAVKPVKKRMISIYLIIFLFIIVVSYKLSLLSEKRIDDNKKLIESNNEKRILLKEIHHRLKNNFSLISSLIDIQFHDTDDDNMLRHCKDLQSRIKTMALVHEKLYQSTDIKHINISNYITDIVEEINKMYNSAPKDINLVINIENIFLTIEHAIPTGLILTEIITNSFKYAFPQNRKKREGRDEIKILITEKENDIIELIVSDNGVGIPENLDINKLDSMGMQLITALIEQLNGEYELHRTNGTQYIIRCKI